MDLIKQIGRYELPILQIVAIQRRNTRGLRRIFTKPGYDVFLINGRKIHFNESEKAEYDSVMDLHKKTLQIYGMAKALGLRG